jgi:hypothetical protein
MVQKNASNSLETKELESLGNALLNKLIVEPKFRTGVIVVWVVLILKN